MWAPAPARRLLSAEFQRQDCGVDEDSHDRDLVTECAGDGGNYAQDCENYESGGDKYGKCGIEFDCAHRNPPYLKEHRDGIEAVAEDYGMCGLDCRGILTRGDGGARGAAA